MSVGVDARWHVTIEHITVEHDGPTSVTYLATAGLTRQAAVDAATAWFTNLHPDASFTVTEVVLVAHTKAVAEHLHAKYPAEVEYGEQGAPVFIHVGEHEIEVKPDDVDRTLAALAEGIADAVAYRSGGPAPDNRPHL